MNAKLDWMSTKPFVTVWNGLLRIRIQLSAIFLDLLKYRTYENDLSLRINLKSTFKNDIKVHELDILH